MTKRILYFVCMSGCVVVATVLFTKIGPVSAKVTLRNHSGFSVEEVVSDGDPGNGPRVIDHNTHSVSSDGSEIVKTLRLIPRTGNKSEHITILDAIASTRRHLDVTTSSVTSYRLPSGSINATRERQSAPCASMSGARATRFGLGVVAYSTENVNKGMRVRMAGWYAPSIGCYPIEERLEFIAADGKPLGYTDRKVTSVRLIAPKPDTFLVPVGYDERRPSEVIALSMKESKSRVEECIVGTLKRLDAVYARLRTEASTRPHPDL